MDDQVLRAILALDSYNRGYGQGILGLSDDEGILLGTAEIVLSDGFQDAQNVGFYAIAYEWNGETIISYRGTGSSPFSCAAQPSTRVRPLAKRFQLAT